MSAKISSGGKFVYDLELQCISWNENEKLSTISIDIILEKKDHVLRIKGWKVKISFFLENCKNSNICKKS